MQILGEELEMDIIFYDYEGYGPCDTCSSNKQLLRDLKCVYDYACKTYRPENIILFGEGCMLIYFVIWLISSGECTNMQTCSCLMEGISL